MKKMLAMRMVALLLTIATILPLVGCNKNAGSVAKEEMTTVNTEQTTAATVDTQSEPEITTAAEEEPTEMTDSTETTEATKIEETEVIPKEDEIVEVEPGKEETVTPEDNIADEENELDEAQKNSVAMLNHLAVLSQEINASKNSRMFLEEAYASLINNTNPEKVNDLTQSHMSSLLDIIEKYRMISTKRERLEYIYNQNKAKALREAVPNPIGMLSAVNSFDLKRLAASAVYMAVDSYSSYQAYNEEIAQDFLRDGWVLDDEEAENLHESRKRAFMFMIEIVREDNLPGELALSENAVDNFVTWKNNSNQYQKIQFLESEESTYQAFGNYWLTLAECYYESGEYKKCLEAIDKYEELKADIFRKDYYLAKILPKAIAAADEIYGNSIYIGIAERYLDLLINNIESSEWSMYYFAAEVYLDLYARTGKKTYLTSAYEIAVNNVNNLVEEQIKLNEMYLKSVEEIKVPDNATKEEKRQIKEYNKSLSEKRKTELPPVYEPLALNCDLLFAIADKCDVTQKEKSRIERILRGNGEALFLSKDLENRYSYMSQSFNFNADFAKNTLNIPVECLNENSVLKVTVTSGGKKTVYDDWMIKEVIRPTEEVTTYVVTYTSKNISKHVWDGNSTIKVEILDATTNKKSDIVLKFKVSKYKNMWVLKDTIEFEQVS